VTDVYLHIGLPKTGTTSIQHALQTRKDALAERGFLFPGGNHHAQRLAAYDLLGRRIEGADATRIPGSFRRLVREIDAHDGPGVVVSEELLALARPVHVRKLVRALRRHRVHVVVGVRDLGRTLVSAWQQEIVMGRTFSWCEYAAAVRDPDQAGVRAGVAFWIRHDVFRVLDTWERRVPRERVRLVTVPPPGTPSEVLLDRFAEAVGLPAGSLHVPTPPRNESLGVAELEVVRRLNTRITGPLTRNQYLHVTERGIRPGLRLPDSRPLRLPAEDRDWVERRSDRVIARLDERGHPLHGDLADLVPAAPALRGGGDARRIDEVSDAELLAASEVALATLSRAHGALFTRYRRAFVQQKGEEPGPLELLGSSTRAAGFRMRESALDRADSNRLLAWAARTYLRRTSR
jgi:hypothetical protein